MLTNIYLRRQWVLAKAAETGVSLTPLAKSSFMNATSFYCQCQADRDNFATLVRMYRHEFPLEIVSSNAAMEKPTVILRLALDKLNDRNDC